MIIILEVNLAAPVKGVYRIFTIDGKVFTQAAHSTKEDLELAVDPHMKHFKHGEKHRQQAQ
jgi:aldehyde dehydrogenase